MLQMTLLSKEYINGKIYRDWNWPKYETWGNRDRKIAILESIFFYWIVENKVKYNQGKTVKKLKNPRTIRKYYWSIERKVEGASQKKVIKQDKLDVNPKEKARAQKNT